MTTKDEALALALEALEKVIGYTENGPASFTAHDCWKRDKVSALHAITAIKQAQQAQESEGPDYEDGPDEDGFSGPRPWNSYAAPQAPAPKQAEPVNCDTCAYHYKDTEQKPCKTCTHRGDLADNFEPRVTP